MHSLSQRLQGALARRPWLGPSALAVLAGVVLFARLDQPGRIIFDEVYYVEDARGYLATGVEPDFAVHPTLGKWLIAASIWLLGDTPVGWRAAGALAGVVVVVLTHLLARRLLVGVPEGWWLALLAPLLLLADGLFLAQARIAMLDIHLAMFALAGLYVLVVDHQRRAAAPGGAAGPPRGPSLRVLAGALFGLAIAVKWSGLLALGGAGLLTLGWEVGAMRRGQWSSVGRRLLAVLGSLVVVPALVYVATWVPWLVNYTDTYTAGCEDGAECEAAPADRLAGLVRHHDEMLDFHLGLEATHTYRSDPLGWPVLQRPVVYYWATCSAEDATASPTVDPDTGELAPVCDVAPGLAAEVLAVGNPALWWGFLLLTPLLVGGTVLRDGRSAVPLVGWLATWVPWLFVSRTAFLFYLVPAVPLLAIGVTVGVLRLGGPPPVRRTYLGAVLGAAAPAAAVGLLLWFDVVTNLRVLVLAAALGWGVGAAIGAVADHQADVRVSASGAATGPGLGTTAATGRRQVGRWAAVTCLLVLGVAAWLAPVWLALPVGEEAIRARWFFDSWI